MSIKKLSIMFLSAISLTALLNGCGSSSNGASSGNAARVASEGVCVVCHSTTADAVSGTSIVADYASSLHNPAKNSDAQGCQGCHGGGSQHNGVGPLPYPDPIASGRCVTCHASATASLFAYAASDFVGNCARCHTASGTGGLHGAMIKSEDCTKCHDVAISGTPQHRSAVNTGVRAVTTEFNKWAHHVTGATLNAAHCAACHLEGKADGGKIVIDRTKHMSNGKTHLRNADDDSDIQWDPAAPNFTNMDNFCLSCHDSDGASSAGSKAIQAVINATGVKAAGKTASATNPFGDTISNQYDELQRPAVVDAKGQFATANPSHHAVLGKKYSGRTRTGTTRAVAAGFAANSSAALPGVRSTIYDAGKFESNYTTLADSGGESGTRNGGTDLGDDSTLHCGDCHTVGQYRAKDVGTRYNNAVIGAHGSNNEYLLRNNAGTDERHTGTKFAGTLAFGDALGYNKTTQKLDGTQPYLVCFNCHAFKTYGTVTGVSGYAGNNHGGEYANQDRCNGPYNTNSEDLKGEARLEGIKTNNNGTALVPSGNTFSNFQGIQCSNCHNSGVSAGNIFGGIHGSKQQTYTDGMGNTTKSYRFFPGLGNSMFVPGTRGGFTGGTLKTYGSYSGNRNGTGTGNATGQTFTMRPIRTTVPGIAGATPYATAAAPGYTTGSYQYITGGTSSDLNWEQKTQQPVAGTFDYQAKSMGCYTLSPTGATKETVAANGDLKLAAADGQLGPDGRVMFDNWGGCDDHNNAQGTGTNIVRRVLRKVSY